MWIASLGSCTLYTPHNAGPVDASKKVCRDVRVNRMLGCLSPGRVASHAAGTPAIEMERLLHYQRERSI